MAKQRRVVYPEHPCLLCKEPTTNKTYCSPCERKLKQPKLVHKSMIPLSEIGTLPSSRV